MAACRFSRCVTVAGSILSWPLSAGPSAGLVALLGDPPLPLTSMGRVGAGWGQLAGLPKMSSQKIGRGTGQTTGET